MRNDSDSQTKKKEHVPQWKRALERMQKGYYLTSLSARTDLGIISFPKRITEIRRNGHKVEQESITVKTRYGKARVNQYWVIPVKL